MLVLVCAVRKKYKYFKDEAWSLLQAICTWKEGVIKIPEWLFWKCLILPDWYRQFLCSLCIAQPKLSVGFQLHDTFLLIWEKKMDEKKWVSGGTIVGFGIMLEQAAWDGYRPSWFPLCHTWFWLLCLSFHCPPFQRGSVGTIFMSLVFPFQLKSREMGTIRPCFAAVACESKVIAADCVTWTALCLAWTLEKKRKIFNRFLNLSVGEIVYRNIDSIQVKY